MNFAERSVFYHIYPLGLLGAEQENDFDSPPISRLPRLKNWIPHLSRLGADAVYIGPLFESTRHGYDTQSFTRADRRLGTNEDLAGLIAAFHDCGIRVILDGVFNHVGRNFWAFEDVRRNGEHSRHASWFYINFSGNSGYNDGFWYEGWEGHYELVKLNLDNPEVCRHILDSVGMWIDTLSIDGLRLDVAYSLSHNFLEQLCAFCRNKKADFWLMGEALHGDYRNLMDGGKLDSVTNYECYKGLYSSFNDDNMFEIAYSLGRQFGKEGWTLYKGRHLFNFLDNHDVSRIASILRNPAHLPLAYALLFTMPGIPCVYYGSEWGIGGDKRQGDDALRPQLEAPVWNEASEYISILANIRKRNACLTHGDYKQLHLASSQFIFERQKDGERVIIAINADAQERTAHFNANAGCGTDLITGQHEDFGGGLCIPGYCAKIIKI